MRRLLTLAPLLAALLSGCATGYTERHGGSITSGFGYEDWQLETDYFKISFVGNSSTGVQTVEDLALLRCADVALKNGFSHFAIEWSNWNVTLGQTIPLPVTANTTGTATVVGNTAYINTRTTYQGGQSLPTTWPMMLVEIRGYKSGKAPNVYDAQALRSAMRAKYGISG